MYLKTVEMSGFKSFVDKTVIPVRSNMNAIVGPNGCGKSNVVDAIRWVIGEMSAKQLRGQSMSDVIFNGSAKRKPVGKASVQLLFDNSDGRIGGEYAKFGEISIRREVEREGQSNYYINGTLCCRKDIVKIFLGTGIGSRSYAIIEQGVISQIIDAKPEDLRNHLEEAAGISKYKERRRDTANRMKRTQENLDRLNDLVEQLTKQLRHLKRQANAAERYKVLKQEERLLQAQIKALNWAQLQHQLQTQDQRIAEKQTAYDSLIASQREVELEAEKLRSTHVELTDVVNEVQKRFYGLGAEIARLEQRIKHNEEQIDHWTRELADISQRQDELTNNMTEQSDQVEELNAALTNIEPQAQALQQEAELLQQQLADAQSQMADWTQRWEMFRSQSAKAQRNIDVAQNTMNHSTSQHERLLAQKERQQQHLQGMAIEELRHQIMPLEQSVAEKEQVSQQLLDSIEQNREQINDIREQINDADLTLSDEKERFQKIQSQYLSLDALQKAALGSDDEAVTDWLSGKQLQDKPVLGKQLKVASGWEVAVETVLRGAFETVCVDDVAALVSSVSDLASGSLSFIQMHQGGASQPSLSHYSTLLQHVTCDWSLDAWLNGIYAANDLAEAIAIRQKLALHESVITPDGVWMGVNWLKVVKKSNQEDSVLLREEKLRELQDDIERQQQVVEQADEHMKSLKSQLESAEALKDDKQHDHRVVAQELSQLKTECSVKKSQLEQKEQQKEKATRDLQLCQEQLDELSTRMMEASRSLREASAEKEALDLQEPNYLGERDRYQQAVSTQNTAYLQAKQAVDEWEIRTTSNQNQLNVLQQAMTRDQKQIDSMASRRTYLQDQLAAAGEPNSALNKELQEYLAQRLTVEQEVQQAESRMQQCNDGLRESEQAHHQLLNKVSATRDQLQSVQMEHQAITVRQSTIVEQIKDSDFILENLIAEMPEDACLNQWQDNCSAVTQRIERLGAINLAAIEEYESLQERKQYLDQQNADLVEALEILEGAMKKIDRETRAKFKDTFNQVNAGLQQLFPKIFGGGFACLELEENDLLTSGVLIKAQPPGKRNSSISMLSGGEKALTAISLVFSMFKLNPAPFCVLDEVDAPLDDVNVGRFCNLVSEMAKEVQFLVISHNKVTIEAANHLMGVTMQEAGVSRIVSVDMDEAVALAEA